jgi:hypothetical protein
LSVYLFLAWIIMDSALFPFQALNQDPPAKADPAQVTELERKLEGEFTGYAPVVSGLWGYLARDVLRKNGGHHFIDFWAEQIPAWEKRDILLVLPGSTNPWMALSGLSQKFPPGQVEAKGALLLSQSQTWRFFLLDRPP